MWAGNRSKMSEIDSSLCTKFPVQRERQKVVMPECLCECNVIHMCHHHFMKAVWWRLLNGTKVMNMRVNHNYVIGNKKVLNFDSGIIFWERPNEWSFWHRNHLQHFLWLHPLAYLSKKGKGFKIPRLSFYDKAYEIFVPNWQSLFLPSFKAAWFVSKFTRVISD